MPSPGPDTVSEVYIFLSFSPADQGSVSFMYLSKVTPVNPVISCNCISDPPSTCLAIFSLFTQTSQPSSLPPLKQDGHEVGHSPGPQHCSMHSHEKQNLADPVGLIHDRPIFRVAPSAIEAAAYLLIA